MTITIAGGGCHMRPETRRKILTELSCGQKTASQIAHATGIAKSAIHKGLKCLIVEKKVIRIEHPGAKWIYYRLIGG